MKVLRTRRTAAVTQRTHGVLALVVAAMGVFAAVALADDISNSLDGSIDAVAEQMPLNAGGANGTTTLYVTPQNGDGKNGCNLSSGSLVVSVASSNTAVATVSPSSITFSGGCATTPTLTVTPHSQGTATISLSQTSNSTGGTFNLAPARFTVNVEPPANTAPSLSISGVGEGLSYEHGAVPAAMCDVTDAEDGNSSFPATLGAITGPHASLGLGLRTASCSYTDGGGLSASSSATYSIVDTNAPTLSGVPADITAEATSAAGAAVAFTDPTASDTVDPAPSVSCSPASGSTFALGTTPVTCSARDAVSNTSSSSFNVRVRDTTAPGLVGVPDDIVAEATSADGADVGYDEPTATDAVDSNPSVECTPIAGSTFAIGTTTVVCTATDDAGNSSSGMFDVTVQDTTPPALTVPADIVAEATGPDGAAVTFATSATDAVDASPSIDCDRASGSTFALGETTVSCTASDATGNTSTAKTFKVTVRDTTPPSLGSMPDDITVAATGVGGATATYTKPAATDIVDSDPDVDCTPASGSTFAPGLHTVSCVATDAAGNPSAPGTFKVRVNFNVRGFLAPVDNASAKIMNTAKGGSTVPLKFQVLSASGGYITDTAVVSRFTAGLMSCSSTEVPEDVMTTSGGTSLRYDASANQFIQNWQTPKTAGKCYRAVATLVGGQTVVADFQLK